MFTPGHGVWELGVPHHGVGCSAAQSIDPALAAYLGAVLVPLSSDQSLCALTSAAWRSLGIGFGLRLPRAAALLELPPVSPLNEETRGFDLVSVPVELPLEPWTCELLRVLGAGCKTLSEVGSVVLLRCSRALGPSREDPEATAARVVERMLQLFAALAGELVDMAALVPVVGLDLFAPPHPAGDAQNESACAEHWVARLREAVPPAVPAVLMAEGRSLTGGALAATRALNTASQCARQPWQLGFCYGRSLLDWDDPSGCPDTLLHRAKMNSAACSGNYSDALERGEVSKIINK
ncbi:MAG: class I fructose-bisphosphate aldolase [Pseudomonadota bacterium]|nr:class I fructose-bisphosphate aldolase [Pseudomonadota bacterium]